MEIIASKWSQSLKTLFIGNSWPSNTTYKCLIFKSLTALHEMRTSKLTVWRMENVENIDGAVRCLAMSWPKLRCLRLPLDRTSLISLSTLRIIAENCPDLRDLQLDISLDTSTIPPFDTSKSFRHKLEDLTLWRAHPSDSVTLEYQIQVAQYLDFIFPYLKLKLVHPKDKIWSGIHHLVKL